jgi:hypothetical protein
MRKENWYDHILIMDKKQTPKNTITLTKNRGIGRWKTRWKNEVIKEQARGPNLSHR